MMKKNKALILITTFFIIAIFAWLSLQEKESRLSLSIPQLNKQNHTLVEKNNFENKHDQEIKIVTDENEKIQRSPKNQDVKELLHWLTDKDNKVEKRIAKVSELSNEVDHVRPQLIGLIVSKNPYEHVERGPHTYNEHLFNQEAALRVHSMKILAAQLNKSGDLRGSFLNIAQNADDETIKTIAQEVLAYNKRGRSFFHDIPKGIRSLKPPQD